MDVATLFGILGALTAVLLGYYLEGGHLSSLLNPSALCIVLGGTLGAAMVETPMATLIRAFVLLPWALFPPTLAFQQVSEKLVNWCSIARKEGFLGLESIAESEPDSFSRKGLHLLIDGSDSKVIRNVLEVELQTIEQRDILSAKVFESMGGYSPTIGIIGAVLGLIHVLGNLNDPNKLGPGIAVAFVATIYGVSLANLIFLPISQKIQKIIFSQSRLKEMVIEGLLSIAEGENPRVLELKMQGFFVARK